MKYATRIFLYLLVILFVGTARHAGAQCLSASNQESGSLFKTTGDPSLDAAINSEANSISQAFGVSPELYTLDDRSSANAFADCENNEVKIGLRLLHDELWNMSHGTLAVAGIMAHEFTHIYQCQVGGTLRGSDMELQADYMAGWYMGHQKAAYGLDVSGFARSLWSMGDYNFRDPTHHGTPDQRVAAMAAGFANRATSVETAFAGSNAYLGHGGGTSSSSTTASTAAPRMCQRQVPCTHVVACQHRVACQHYVTTTQLVACTHFVMTPYGYMPMHQADAVPVTVPAHDYDVEHPAGDLAHPYDVETYPCGE